MEQKTKIVILHPNSLCCLAMRAILTPAAASCLLMDVISHTPSFTPSIFISQSERC